MGSRLPLRAWRTASGGPGVASAGSKPVEGLPAKAGGTLQKCHPAIFSIEGGRAPMKRRMPGGANPIESVARAREHLTQIRPPAQVNALLAMVWMTRLLR